MNKKRTFQFIAGCLVTSLTACGATRAENKIPSNDKVLVVDLHTFMPTDSSSADLVSITVTQTIADEFEEATGIRIKWYTGKSLDGEVEQASGDYIKSIQNGTMPAIGFSWSAFTDRGYYLDLNKYLATENEFLSESEKAKYPTWKDQFPSYLWDTKECVDANGTIIAVPLLLNPGPATGWFYNKTKFDNAGYDVPTTWNQFRELCMDFQGDTTGPFVYNQTAKITNWELKFSIGPAFANALVDVVDTNKDGKVSEGEKLEGVLNGTYSPLQSENPQYYQIAQGCYQVLKDFYKSMLPDNWKTANAETCWSNGQAMMRQNGLWSIRAENGENSKRSWKYGIFAAPVVGKDSQSFLNNKGLTQAAAALNEVDTVKVEEKEEWQISELGKAFTDLYKPDASLYVNLMKHGIYDNEKVLENAVKFLKFLSTPKNVSRMCNDHQGVLGGVMGATPGTALKSWLQQTFPVVPQASWPEAYTVANNNTINTALAKWIAGTMDDNTFYQTIASEQKAGAQAYKNSLSQVE